MKKKTQKKKKKTFIEKTYKNIGKTFINQDSIL